MNLSIKHSKLIHLLSQYLDNQIGYEPLNDFAWEIIDYFTENKVSNSSLNQDSENAFWYAIWQIQHLADKEHSDEGLTKREFSDILSYLNGDKILTATAHKP
ncbi:MAG: hypothetical protein ACR2MD_10960 [Aridibacter sp.]